MGTSNAFGGGNNRNPLIPDWIGGEGPAAAPSEPRDGNPDGADPGDGNPEGPGGGGEPAPNRFQSARTNFFKFAKTGGGGGGGSGGKRGGESNRNMRRAIGSFVSKASGGAPRAARRMAAERSATAGLARILFSAGTVGIQQSVRQLGFEQLATLPIADIYAALVDVICGPGGELDESFAREAYIKALTEISETRADLERPSPETSESFLASFITNAIQNRLLNAIGNKVVSIPRDVASVQNVEHQINDYIRGNVNDAMLEARSDFPIERIVSTIDDIYERALVLLEDSDQRERDAGAHDEAVAEAYEEIA